jgi:hypothetical protein
MGISRSTANTNYREVNLRPNNCQDQKQTPLQKPREVSQEQFDHATGCYIASAHDEMGLSAAARCLYFHLVRRANGSKENEESYGAREN